MSKFIEVESTLYTYQFPHETRKKNTLSNWKVRRTSCHSTRLNTPSSLTEPISSTAFLFISSRKTPTKKKNISEFLHFFLANTKSEDVKRWTNKQQYRFLYCLSTKPQNKHLVFIFLHKSALIDFTEIYCHRHTHWIELVYLIVNKLNFFCSFDERWRTKDCPFFISAKWYWIYSDHVWNMNICLKRTDSNKKQK